ncbi:COX15/CtaA family protein [Sphingomonas sp.]|jgi:cytochrome c oxidase assembly protein subunit 15|uniref:COX15/CtaA family protein n=1 Tax=Sphingomonas sp. TaxID=28214 RepID=UPI002E381A62|nr:COX15/CtaA family protein [Sphingomonas sp.]HEX4695587.1 COX15/CtaA family protein [Sphingomonas sp.]
MSELMPANARPRAIAAWLWFVAGLIIAMVVVGGITRLTESGLSITEWKPLTGIVPPLNDAQWQAEFANYLRIPQAQTVHAGITLAGFKTIFFWEYIHRLLGRVIGMAFALPLIWFAVRRQIPKGYVWRLVALFALGGLQGALGWIMVRSGLSVRTEVAPALLAAHLLTALFTLAGIVWTALDLRALARDPSAKPARLTGFGAAAGVVLLVQLFYGALMAGLRAGLVADDWPLMNGHLFPGATQLNESLGAMLFTDPAIVHFIHRWWAWAVVTMLVVLGRKVRRTDRRASVAIHVAFGTQILLGIATVMSQVDITFAALHQLVGALLVVATTWGVHALGQRKQLPVS